MPLFKNLFFACTIVLLIAVAYATFWILVILAVVFILYKIIGIISDEEVGATPT